MEATHHSCQLSNNSTGPQSPHCQSNVSRLVINASGRAHLRLQGSIHHKRRISKGVKEATGWGVGNGCGCEDETRSAQPTRKLIPTSHKLWTLEEDPVMIRETPALGLMVRRTGVSHTAGWRGSQCPRIIYTKTIGHLEPKSSDVTLVEGSGEVAEST